MQKLCFQATELGYAETNPTADVKDMMQDSRGYGIDCV